jgi:hypothetical protein
MQPGQLLARSPQDLRGIEVLAGFLKDFGNDPPLASHAEAVGLELARDPAPLLEVLGEDHL